MAVQDICKAGPVREQGVQSGRKRQKQTRLRAGQTAAFLTEMKKNGRSDATIKKYAAAVERFSEFLGEEKLFHPDSLALWKQELASAGYAARTINSSIVAVNSLFHFMGCRDCQYFGWLELEETETPELKREEYIRLLREAWKQENIQLYLLIKILACTELTPGDIELITREAVNEGVVSGKIKGTQRQVHLMPLLREELMDFAIHRSIRSGPVFLNTNGNCLDRTAVSRMIAVLGADCGLEPGKANPRNLRKLYLNTLSVFQKQADEWMIQNYNRLLRSEEAYAGWRVLCGRDSLDKLDQPKGDSYE